MYQIGFGGFGKVWKVQERNSWDYYAMKEIQKRKYLLVYIGLLIKTVLTAY